MKPGPRLPSGRCSLFAYGAFLIFFLWGLLADAQGGADARRTAARALADQGAERYEHGDWAGALDRFQHAYELMAVPSFALFEARCLAQLGRLVEAHRAYVRAETTTAPSDPAGVSRQAVREARDEGAALRRRIPQLRIEVEGAPADAPDLRVLLDGNLLSRESLDVEHLLDPGPHRVEARYADTPHAPLDVNLREGERRSLTLHFVALSPVHPARGAKTSVQTASPAKGSAQRLGGWVALGVGGVGLGVGVVTGVLLFGKKSILEDVCPNGTCPPEQHDKLDTFRSLRTMSNVAYGVGLLGVGAGALLLVTAPSAKRTAWLRPWVGFGGAGISGIFLTGNVDHGGARTAFARAPPASGGREA